jgi:hypothetical protein
MIKYTINKTYLQKVANWLVEFNKNYETSPHNIGTFFDYWCKPESFNMVEVLLTPEQYLFITNQ